jgi:hypothetical protein
MQHVPVDRLAVPPSVRAALHEAQTGLHHLYGKRLRALVLFGSHARHEAHAESDVDLMVVLDGAVHLHEEARRTSDLVLAVSLHHQVALSLLHLPTERFHHRQHPLMMQVR